MVGYGCSYGAESALGCSLKAKQAPSPASPDFTEGPVHPSWSSPVKKNGQAETTLLSSWSPVEGTIKRSV